MNKSRILIPATIFVFFALSAASASEKPFEGQAMAREATDIDPDPVFFLPYPYLIIYADVFEGNTTLETFAQWKRKTGFEVEMVKMTDTGVDTLDDEQDYQAIRDYIRDNWWDPNWAVPAYVLLVGDAPVFQIDPYPGPSDYALPTRVHDGSHIPVYLYGANAFSDYYYQLLTGGDSPDPYPDVSVGRWCARLSSPSSSDLEVYVSKTLNYENPNLSAGWRCDRALFASQEPMEAIHHQTKLAVLDTVLKYRPHPDYNVRTCWGHETRNLNVKDSITQDSGVGIVNYCGHGNPRGWGPGDYGWCEWKDTNGETHFQCFWDTTIRTLNNAEKYPVVFQTGSSMGMFTAPEDYNNPQPGATQLELESSVEAWTRHANGGAVAAFGASTAGSYTPETDKLIFRYLFSENLDYVHAINRAKVHIIDSLEGPEKMLYNAHEYNWIGDPSLNMWRRKPQEASISALLFLPPPSGPKIEVTVATKSDVLPVPGARVCFYCEGVCHWIAYTDEWGKAYFPYPSGLTDPFCITATNQTGPISIKPISTYALGYPTGSCGTDEKHSQSLEWRLELLSSSPMNTTAVISYSVAGTQEVDLGVFDVSGRKMRTLVHNELAPGNYQATWDGCDAAGAKCPDGVYFVLMQSKGFTASQRLVKIK